MSAVNGQFLVLSPIVFGMRDSKTYLGVHSPSRANPLRIPDYLAGGLLGSGSSNLKGRGGGGGLVTFLVALSVVLVVVVSVPVVVVSVVVVSVVVVSVVVVSVVVVSVVVVSVPVAAVSP